MEPIYNLLVYVTLLLPPVSILSSPGCNFLAVFNFGDSNPDAGALVAMFGQAAARPPNGETFFGSPAGRVCNDRLLIVFKFRWVGFFLEGDFLCTGPALTGFMSKTIPHQPRAVNWAWIIM
ncbi:putative alpha-L-fucosidase [Helianthus anomalus]